jgi:hypothetical protein
VLFHPVASEEDLKIGSFVIAHDHMLFHPVPSDECLKQALLK